MTWEIGERERQEPSELLEMMGHLKSHSKKVGLIRPWMAVWHEEEDFGPNLTPEEKEKMHD